ncbi:peptidylprolyl isomerase [Alteromonas pelagimontana]|uniref:peptidylprolyl isomerase n=1 Tax=Alteromonas pelagimontana TaxID=1858656 RepID=A0A6M4M9Q6_9ALTE|nr:peptidylprolyl isomerase [Alteromonas pelagimontana]QJR79709.1 peptidylprolyl isomerase [Alteromonas pelagimontana]
MTRRVIRYLSLLLKTSTIAGGLFFQHQSFAENEEHWYTVPQSDLVYMQTNQGAVVVALTDAIAPHHVSQFKTLIRHRFYDNRYFYRVIEGFVAQAGTNGTHDPTEYTNRIAAEFSASSVEGFYEVERPAPFAPVSGFINGFPAATTVTRESYWLANCPGALAMARDNKKDSADTEFYIVIGQAPRHLDRNMSVFGRVMDGMAALQKLPRGEAENAGVIKDFSEKSEILYVRLGEDLPKSEQRHFRIQLPSHPQYQKKIATAKELDNPFFVDKQLAPRPIDICYYQTDVEEVYSPK